MHNKTLFITREYKATLSNNLLILKSDDDEKSFCLDEINDVVFEDEKASVSLCLLNALTEKNVGVMICNSKKLPQSFLLPVYGNGGTSGKVFRQVAWAKERLAVAWQKIVSQKIDGQKQVLDHFSKSYDFAESVKPNDITNAEGRFADLYFHTLFGKNFKRHLSDNINSALNYGYAILLSKTCQIIVSHGYITQYGIHHCGQTNKYNLAYDVMESFRPIVDVIVYRLRDKTFGVESKKALIEVLNTEIKYKGKRYKTAYAIELFFTDLISYIENGEDAIGEIKLF